MKCPKCKTKVERVRVYSEQYQYAIVNSQGEIIEYEETFETMDSEKTEIECVECDESLKNLITE